MTDETANPQEAARPLEEVVIERLEAKPEPEAGAAEAQPESAQQEAPAAAPATTEEEPPSAANPSGVWRLKHSGREVDVPHDEAIQLAQMGFDYRAKTAALAAERRRLAEAIEQLERQGQTAAQPAQPQAAAAPELDPEVRDLIAPALTPLQRQIEALNAQVSAFVSAREREAEMAAATRFMDGVKGELGRLYPQLNPDHVIQRAAAFIDENATEDEMRAVIQDVARETEEWRRGLVATTTDQTVRAKQQAPRAAGRSSPPAVTAPPPPTSLDDYLAAVQRRVAGT